jgi:hypothetical protein
MHKIFCEITEGNRAITKKEGVEIDCVLIMSKLPSWGLAFST